MPHIGLFPAAFRQLRGQIAMAPPSGRLVGLMLCAMGLACGGLAAAPMLAGAQSASLTIVHDPGVRPGPAGAGGPIAGATANEKAVFTASRTTFKEVDSVSGAVIDGSNGSGLGPGFNMDSCAGCHAQPEVGGSSPFTNPQIAVANRGGASNPRDLSAFIRIDGPVREVRFVKNPDGSPDGGVHDLFTISGRSDAVGCTISQPDFATALANNNAIFRIPTPVFGAGLIEAIADQTILNNKNANSDAKRLLGISGRENREGNTGTITRFGWKAQNKSLEIFGGEAYNVEQGVSNEVFPDERDQTPGCQFNSTPEDHSTLTVQHGELVSSPGDVGSFSVFMRLLAPPARQQVDTATADGAALAVTIQSGEQYFNAVGCGLCHTPSLDTGKASSADPGVASSTALTTQHARLFSDLLLHNMGSGLADGVSQGAAQENEFRSAPLWGLGKRIFFLHDGRTNDLLRAIQAHSSSGSEANAVIFAFNLLPDSQKQNLLVFLRSL